MLIIDDFFARRSHLERKDMKRSNHFGLLSREKWFVPDFERELSARVNLLVDLTLGCTAGTTTELIDLNLLPKFNALFT